MIKINIGGNELEISTGCAHIKQSQLHFTLLQIRYGARIYWYIKLSIAWNNFIS